jgi:hypothetical protein
MNRKKIVTIISILFVLVVGGLIGGYFYLTNTKTSPTSAPSGVGSLSGDQANNNANIIINTSSSTPGQLPKLRQLTQTPVAGYDFVDQGKGYVVWYVDRGNGNVFQTATSTLEITKITNTTIPKVYEAFIGKGGSNIILRFFDDNSNTIQTFIGSPKKSQTSTSSDEQIKNLTGIFIADNIKMLSFSSNKDSLFGIVESNQGVGNIYSFSGKATNIFSSPLKNWIPQWVNSNTVALTSSPSAKTQNISFFLNTKNGTLTKTLGPKNGLVVSSSPDASHLLFSENKANTLVFGISDVKNGTETQLPNETIPDKCVWSKQNTSLVFCGFPKTIPAGLYPDYWYQGKVFFDDTIGSFDVKASRFTTNTDLKNESGVSIDATNLVLSKDDKYLLFTNKRDLTLWMLEL